MIDFDEFYRVGIIPIRDWNLFWVKLEHNLEKTPIRAVLASPPFGASSRRELLSSCPKRLRCGLCVECLKSNCGKCINCLDKLGRNKRKQRCKNIGSCLKWNKF